MAKNGLHLSLVRKSAQSSDAELERRTTSFIVAALTELAPKEQARLKQVVSSICRHEGSKSGAAILGVQLGSSSVEDYRPVLMASSENNPSLIRLSDTEISLSAVLTTRLQETIEQIGSYAELSELTHTLEWGVIDGQIFYRREVVDRTLLDLLESQQVLSFADAISIARNIVAGVELFHSRGVAHGHITCSNVAVARDNTIGLIDPGVGLASFQAAISLGQEIAISDEALASFAPETRSAEVLSLKADIYGLGRVFSALFSGLGSQFQPGGSAQRQANSLQTLQDAVAAMTDEQPTRRPSLAEIKQLLGQRVEPKPIGEVRRPTASAGVVGGRQAPSQGKKVSIKRSGRSVGRYQPEVTQRHSSAWTEAKQDVELDQFIASQSTPVAKTPEPEPEADVVVEGSGAETSVQAEVPNQQIVELRRPPVNGSWLPLFFFLGAIALVAYVSSQVLWDWNGGVETSQEEGFSKRELELAWYSKRPSLMGTVAEAAVSKGSGNRFAEMLVVQSFINDDLSVSGVNKELGSIAFDQRWEAELNEEDRRLALSLALSPLLREKAPRDLIAPEAAHPGVLLGIVATASSNPRARAVLKSISASQLSTLPGSLGLVFRQLVSENPEATCADQEVADIARFATVGPKNAEEIIAFANPNPQLHIRFLALLYEQNEEAAKGVLAVLLQHPNLQLESPLVQWAKRWDLYSWKGVSEADKLMILSGRIPEGSISSEHLAMFFSHPLDTVRATAIRASIDAISFKHPSSLPLLKTLSDKAEILTATQTIFLAQLLEEPDEISVEQVRQWLKLEPPREIVMALVVGSATKKEAYKFDFELGRYLSVSGWKPSVTTLKGLAGHPEPFLRLVAYDKLFGLSDKQTAYKVLKWALALETEPEYQSQLRRMLASLKSVK